MLLELKNIAKHFPTQKNFLGKSSGLIRAVDDVSLVIQKGESLALVGESGCGKTTLARIICKLIPLNSGTMLFEREEITRLSNKDFRKFRRNIQIVFQDPHSSLDPRFTIRNILKEAMTLVKLRYKTVQSQEIRIQQLLTAVGLESEMLNRYPHEFSGGERQRIAIARALVMNPKLLILDEAVSSLDVLIQEQIIQLLAGLKSQFDLTYLFISHNLRVVRKICQKIAVMYKGKIVELGTTDQIFNNPLHPYTKELLTAAIEYKAVTRTEDIIIDPTVSLTDQGDGHFLMC